MTFAGRARATLQRDIGAAVLPGNALQTIQGLETLPLRVARHSNNAARVADFLAAHAKVARVIYPGLQSGKARRRADAVLRDGYGGLVGFELADAAAGRRFIEALELFRHLANIGDARSLAIHPASTTHSQLTEAEQQATGVTQGYVRLSIGIEHGDDIVADLDQALARS
jgi:O-acetylhomoserine (thiol)-lyase